MARRFFYTTPLRAALRAEAFEPTLAWSARMALASVVPVVWGTVTGHHEAAGWMALAAQAICWVELKSGFGGRLRILLGGILLAVLFTSLGSIAGRATLFAVIGMAAVGFIAGMFKNLGDRGAGLSISVYVLFIIGAAYPIAGGAALAERAGWVALGGVWNAVLGMSAVFLSGERSATRQAVGRVWRASADVFRTVAQGWDGAGARAGLRTLYTKETAVRAALDAALTHDSAPAAQGFPLADVRRAGGLSGALAGAIGETLATLRRHELTGSTRRRLHRLFRALASLSENLGLATATLRSPDAALAASIEEARDELAALTGSEAAARHPELARSLHLAGRSLRLAERAREALGKLRGEKPFYRSPSMLRLVLALHPRHWWSALRLLISPQSSTLRYATRIALVSALAMGVYHAAAIPRGYWLPLTVIVVAQPYFGATLKKARERVIGTVGGAVLGGLLLLIPTGIFLREAVLAATSALMVFYARKNYSVASVFVTVTLVLVLSTTDEANARVLAIRALCTAAGASLAVAAGFLLLPTWDKTSLPRCMAAAFAGVYEYFIVTFYRESGESWTAAKRRAERATASAFDALTRYLAEPGATRRMAGAHFGTLAHLVRMTHELNALHLHGSSGIEDNNVDFSSAVRATLQRFNQIFFLLRERTGFTDVAPTPLDAPVFRPASTAALLALEHIADELQAFEADLSPMNHRAQNASPTDTRSHPSPTTERSRGEAV